MCSLGVQATVIGCKLCWKEHTGDVGAGSGATSIATPPVPAAADAQPSPTKAGVDRVRCPKPEKTGNTEIDVDNDAKHVIMVNVFKRIAAERPLVLPVYKEFQEQVKAREVKVKHDDKLFDELSTVGRTCKEWNVVWLCRNSNLTLTDLKTMSTQDKESVDRLFHYATQMNLSLKMASECQVIEFVGWYLGDRSAALGNRMKGIKQKPGCFLICSGRLIGAKVCMSQSLLMKHLVPSSH